MRLVIPGAVLFTLGLQVLFASFFLSILNTRLEVAIISPMKKTPLGLLPGLQDIFFTAIFLTVLLFGQRMINLDGDLPRHLLMGRYILQNRCHPVD